MSSLMVWALFMSCILLKTYGKETIFLPDDKYLQTIWTTEDGLPQNSINYILQSRDGYLWLATFGGLVRFDGVKFTTFNSGNTPGLMSNRIMTIFEDSSGTLWLGAETGEVMTFKNGVGKTYTTTDGLPGSMVYDVVETQDGNFWIMTLTGLFRFENGKFISPDFPNGITGKDVQALRTSPDKSLWILTRQGLIHYKNAGDMVFDPLEGISRKLFGLLAGGRRNENVWLHTEKGLASFSGGQITYYSNPDLVVKSEADVPFTFEDEDGAVWLFYGSLKSFYKLKDGVFSLFPLKGDRVRRIFKDREGNLWIGTNGNGLWQLKERKLITYSSANGLPTDAVQTVVGDDQNGVWIATQVGLVHFRDGKFTTYQNQEGMPSNGLSALCAGRDGSLWVGSDNGLMRFKDGKFTTYSTKDGLVYSRIHAVFEDRDGSLWIGTNRGLSRFQDGRFTSFRQSDGLANNNISFIKQTSDGAMWIGTLSGLSRFEDGKFTNYTHEQGLSNNYVRDIFEEPDGSLWLATYGGGLNRLKDGKITVVNMKHGLYDDFVSRIMSDGRGNLWMLGNRGIFRVNLQELDDFADGRVKSFASVSYNVDDGMLSSEGQGVFQPAGWRTADGKMWFPTIKGLAVIEANESTVIVPPPVIIEKIIVDRAEVPVNETLEINPDQENVEIEYTGINFTRPQQVRFKYRLLGLDTSWVDVGTRRTAYFSHLPQGTFTFEVMAESGDGVTSPAVAVLKIVVRPPFWRTWWFLTGCGLIAGFIIFGLFRFRITRLERARLAQEDFSRRLINAHESERRRIAGELHDGLGHSLAMIKNSAVSVAEIEDVPPSAKQQLTQISEQTTQAITEVREISYNLRPYLLDYLGLTKAIKSLLNRISSTTLIEINAEIDDIDHLFGDEVEMSIYRIIQESLNNVLKHANANEVLIAVEKQADWLTITIQDDGKGFEQSSAENVKSKPGGFGLLGIAERVRMLGGTHSIKSEPGKGTVINIGIRLNEKAREERS